MPRLLALTTPGYSDQVINPLLKTSNSIFPNDHLGGIISGFLNLAIFAAGALMIFWMSWGIFQYIFAGGAKENLAHARKRIVFALVGFAIVLLAISIKTYVLQIYTPQLNGQSGDNAQLQQITKPVQPNSP